MTYKNFSFVPDFLKDVYDDISDKNLVFFIIHNWRNILEQIDECKNKIVVIFAVGDYADYGRLEYLLQKNRIHQATTGKYLNYYIVLSPHELDDPILEKYKNEFAYIVDPYLYSYWYTFFTKKNYTPGTKTKYFLSLNNRGCIDRQSLFYFFYKFGLIEKSYFSYIGEIRKVSDSDPTSIKQICNLICKDKIPWYAKRIDFELVHKLIPYKIQNHNFKDVYDAYSNSEDFLYQDTFCSIIFETYYDKANPYFSEKMFKPIIYQHPFILNGAKNSLKFLQGMGFKTFNNFWDEEYDKCGGIERMETIFHLILEIGNWSQEKINDLATKINPILLHNQEVFFSMLPNQFESNKKNYKNFISEILDKKQELLG